MYASNVSMPVYNTSHWKEGSDLHRSTFTHTRHGPPALIHVSMTPVHRRIPLNLAPKSGSAAAAAPVTAALVTAAAAKPALREEETRKKATSIFRDWLGPNRDLEEAALLFQAWTPKGLVQQGLSPIPMQRIAIIAFLSLDHSHPPIHSTPHHRLNIAPSPPGKLVM